MNLEYYLSPTNPVAEGLVVGLFVVLVVWFLILVYTTRRLTRWKIALESCTDIAILRDAVQRAHIPGTTAEIPSTTTVTSEYKAIFQKFVRAKSLPESDPVVGHLRSIFEAGFNDTRLDVAELLRHTSHRLFAWNPLLRGFLGSFIVIGLLGTLVGLADSLIQFSGPLQTSTRDWSNDQIRSSIASLLIQLRGAFAPSIVGVASTILGVLVYSLFLRFVCTPVHHRLDDFTVNIWIPQLIPTTPHRLVETLKRSEEQMRRSFQAAEKVADFAQKIQDEASDFNLNLKSSNKALKQLNEVGTTLSGFATKFADGTERLTVFQEDLRTLYTESLSNSSFLKQNVETALKEAQAFHSTVSTTLRDQSDQISIIASGLRSYETAYVAQRQQIDQALQKLLESVNLILSQIDSKNKDLIEKFGDPLIQELHQELSSVENTLKVQLSAIHQQFQRLEAPITTAAENVSGAIGAVDKRTTALAGELQRAFLKREESVQSQLTTFNELGKNIVTLLTTLESVSNSQSERMQSLTAAINGLQAAVTSVGGDRRRERTDGKAIKGHNRDGILRRLMRIFVR